MEAILRRELSLTRCTRALHEWEATVMIRAATEAKRVGIAGTPVRILRAGNGHVIPAYGFVPAGGQLIVISPRTRSTLTSSAG
jgi:hypothetical protein